MAEVPQNKNAGSAAFGPNASNGGRSLAGGGKRIKNLAIGRLVANRGIWDNPAPIFGRQRERDLMRRLFAMAFGALLGAAAMFIAFKFHVLRTKDDWVFVPKPSASLVDAYVDVREWDTAEWMKHPQLVKSLVLTGRADLVRRSVTNRWMEKTFGEPSSREDDRGTDKSAFSWPDSERQ